MISSSSAAKYSDKNDNDEAVMSSSRMRDEEWDGDMFLVGLCFNIRIPFFGFINTSTDQSWASLLYIHLSEPASPVDGEFHY